MEIMTDRADVTQLLLTINQGDKESYSRLFHMVYEKLKRIAQSQLNREYGEHTLRRTELVHEAYMKLVDQNQIDYNDRNHFFAIASRSMRQILVDHARKKKAQKRGGDQQNLTLDEKVINAVDIKEHADQIIELDELLDELMNMDERLGRIVELRFFGGLSIRETSEILDLSASTANRDWAKARGWLYKRMKNK